MINELAHNEGLLDLCINPHELSFVLEYANEAVLVYVTLALRHLCECVVDLSGSESWYLYLLGVKELIEVFKRHHVLREQGASRIFI